MPLTRRSEGTKIHLLKAAALRVGFLSAEFRRLNLPSSAKPVPPDPVGAFIVTIKRPVPLVGNTMDINITPVGGILPKGTCVVLRIGTNLTGDLQNDGSGIAYYTMAVTLTQNGTGGLATAAFEQEPVPLRNGNPIFTITETVPGTIRLEMVDNPLGDIFELTETTAIIVGGGTTVTYTGP